MYSDEDKSTLNLTLEEMQAHVNLAEEIDDNTLAEIGDKVVHGYDEDMESRSEWEERFDADMKLALQTVEEKSFPWKGASNVKYPILTTAALQFSSRAYPALVSGTQIVKAKVTGFDRTGGKHNSAIRIGKHMSYQLLEEMDNWEEDMDKLCIMLPIVGTVFKKSYFDSLRGRNESELVYSKSLVVNYWAKSLETAGRITQVLELSPNDLYERIASGLYLDVDLTPSDDNNDEGADERSGLQAPAGGDETTPYVLLEQHRWLDLDGDGYAEPYIVTVDEESAQVLRIVSRWDEDGVKYKGEDDNTIVRIEPVHYFTKYSFVPNPDGGFYDIGFGVLLSPINNTVNTLINQLVDSGTLNNLNAGFIAKGIRIKGGNKPFDLGEWKTCSSTADDLRKGIVPLPTKDPSQVLFTLLNMLVESANKLGSVTDILTGENPGQNQPATTTMAVIEQGLKVFSSIYKRMHRSMGKEFKKLYRLNSIYLEPEVYFQVLDAGESVEGKSSQGNVFKLDYQTDRTNVQPQADPNVASESQKLIKAQALLELLQLGNVNPQVVTKRILEAQDQPNIEELMTMPQQGPDQEAVLAQLVAKDESERGWAEIKIKGKLAAIKEFDAIQVANTAFEKSTKEDKDGSNEGTVQ